jgi:hypothetical protein
MQGRAPLGVVQGQISGQRVEGRGGPTHDVGERGLHLVHQGQHGAGIARVAHRPRPGKAEARGGLGNTARLAAHLGGQLLWPLQIGAMVGSSAVTILPWVKGLPRVSRRAWVALCGGASRATVSSAAKRGRCPAAKGVARCPCAGAVRASPPTGCPVVSSGVSVWRTSVTNPFPWPRHWRPKRRISLGRSCGSCCACACSAVPWAVHCSGRCAMTWRTFFSPYTGSRHP